MKTVLRVSMLGLFVLSLVCGQPRSVYAVDIVYWTDKGTLIDGAASDGAIYEIKTDGTGFKTVINTTILQSHSGQESVKIYDPSDVVIDNRAGAQSSWKIYWTDNYGDNTFDIARANYDGSGYQVIKTGLGNTGDTSGLDIDLSGEKLYYSVTNDLRSINLSGTGDASILTAGILSGLSPDPSGTGFVDFVSDLSGFGKTVLAADTNGLVAEALITSDLGITADHTSFGSGGGDPITANAAVSPIYDQDSNKNIVTFSNANDTIYFGDDTTNNDFFFSTGLGGTYSLKDASFDTNVTSGATAYILVNGSATLADGVYRINYNDPPTTPSSLSLLYQSASPGGFNYSGMTIVNPELPPGMLGYLAMMLSFVVVWLRRLRFT